MDTCEICGLPLTPSEQQINNTLGQNIPYFKSICEPCLCNINDLDDSETLDLYIAPNKEQKQ